ncbi:MAG: hypothetical protein DI539_08385 [Flavobacterium psychrophilum]|nr:MAG: hypothetical protein DI539_08385 [Flavobacterium psychrophilum]
MNSPETMTWVKAQNDFSEAHNTTISKSVFPLPTLKKYNAKTQYRIPVSKGKYYYTATAKYLAYQKEIDSRPIKLIDANYILRDSVASIDEFYPSHTSRYIAYTISPNGSDLHQLRFVSPDNGKHLPEIIRNIRFTNIAWHKDEGVYYRKSSNTSGFAIDSTYRMYYHKIGTSTTDDKLLFDTSKSTNLFNFFADEKNQSLYILERDRKSSAMNYYYLNPGEANPVKFLTTNSETFTITGTRSDTLFISSKLSNWGDVRYFSRDNPEKIKILIDEKPRQLLTDSYFYKDRILCRYRTDNESYIALYDYTGKLVKKIQGPKGMDVSLYGNNNNASEIYFTLQSRTIPPILFKLDIPTGQYSRYVSEMYPKTTAPFGIDYFETKKTNYISRDGVEIPITIIFKKGTQFNGNNPTLLEAYGGYGVTAEAHYDNGLIYFLEKGGVYAYAEIRGGGEKGLQWHKSGRGINKINSLNDFIDAAEFLIREKYTSPEKLAITGASHGGLVVGNALVQRPELFKAALPKVGVFDMYNKDSFGAGLNTITEYGTTDTKEGFEAMMSYSPYHNIKEDINYPTTYIITSQNDDRVPPFHSYKFAAKLQNRQAQKNPIYLTAIPQAGHYGTLSTFEEYTEDKSEFYAFILYHLTK